MAAAGLLMWGIEHTRYLAKMRSPPQPRHHFIAIIIAVIVILIVIVWIA